MRVAILGFSDLEQSESLPTYRYFKAKGADITVFYWGEPELPNDVHKVKIDKNAVIDNLSGFDLIVRGPVIHPRQITSDTLLTSLTDIFVKESPSKKIVGVTGTKGKGTTSTLIAKFLEAQGKKVWLGGNIGKPLLDSLEEIKADDWVVLEMSAGQLITFSGRIHIGVCLMVVPEHLDWHTDLEEYTQAKSNLFSHQSADDVAIYFANNPTSVSTASHSPGKKVPYYQKPGAYVRDDGMIVIGDTDVVHKSEVKLLGEHNLQNICAALTAVSEATGSLDKAKAVLHSFSGLEHRLELVREFEGVKYYDDSFAATPDSAIVAMEAIAGKKVTILGGFDRNLPISHLAKAVKRHSADLLKAVLIGVSAQRLAKELDEAGFENYVIPGAKTMTEVVNSAKEFAKPGSSVVLSPGFTSFDMFKNFADRGNQFKEVVMKL
ncbi:UDP-N-acetylmuramoylalanine--D-glutamate ligase [Candidatus Saccharibacteria bacterium RIFCSPHIGHO2_12_FULL_49_19]|nr:MAG: UDP-N-acetylmuramoylalanine--D-glutamate ligase [Candidatus Saccharibacteria bacterium RIFCSPHIGHO2_01_FULL_49_21]OGL37835.1 MAG: UDP-N-acetylmuramoylalanine--D-glutamate ligase [Candidatus Saccharibacteria bacterium RIFCSPHIGHO2_12_FULL_49_19]OGL38326.1 MAG: UDP-N-acetylmuramoylalanine--D-glutamate ligase [Candidatus Saccharibacteria bacterium RIFCSPLOWO2_01_FULL_49_22]